VLPTNTHTRPPARNTTGAEYTESQTNPYPHPHTDEHAHEKQTEIRTAFQTFEKKWDARCGDILQGRQNAATGTRYRRSHETCLKKRAHHYADIVDYYVREVKEMIQGLGHSHNKDGSPNWEHHVPTKDVSHRDQRVRVSTSTHGHRTRDFIYEGVINGTHVEGDVR
jgi:hypothetical protein